MPYLILIFTILFVFSAFLGSLPLSLSNPFVAYIFYQVHFLLHYILFFSVGFLFVFLFFIQKKDTYLRSFFQTIALYITSVFFAFILLLCIAGIELNSIAILTNIQPAILGITIKTTQIVQTLRTQHAPPHIIASDTNPYPEVVAIAKAVTGTTNIYGDALLSAIPDFLVLPIKKLPSSLLLIDNTLIVTEINTKDMQIVSPLIGYLLVQEYFPTRRIRSFPRTAVMDTNEYLTYRKSDAADKLTKATDEVQKMTDSIATISATIQSDTDAINSNSTLQKNALTQQSKQYDACLSTGTYSSGVFQATYSKSDCQKILDLWSSTLDTLSKDEDSLNAQKQKDQQLLKDYEYYKDFFSAQQTLIGLTSTNIPSELGVFVPPDSIKIVVNSKSSHSIGDYFETLAHEYLHYASYVAGKRLDSSFFEEGLTEYFARQTIQDTLQIDTNIGYPVAVKIIQALTNRIPESDLADIYFSKDQTALEKTLDLTYGDNFYKDTITLFESLQYTSDPQQILRLANTIMRKIDGTPLTEKDLFSKESNL